MSFRNLGIFNRCHFLFALEKVFIGKLKADGVLSAFVGAVEAENATGVIQLHTFGIDAVRFAFKFAETTATATVLIQG